MREKLTEGFRQSLNRHFNEKGGITPMSLSRNPDVDTYWKEYCASVVAIVTYVHDQYGSEPQKFTNYYEVVTSKHTDKEEGTNPYFLHLEPIDKSFKIMKLRDISSSDARDIKIQSIL
jgi:hypothetical protein